MQTNVINRQNNKQPTRCFGVLCGLLLLPVTSLALTPLTNESMSQIAGRDGVTIELQNDTGASVHRMKLMADSGDASHFGGMTFDDFTLASSGTPISLSYDVGEDKNKKKPAVLFKANWKDITTSYTGSVCQDATCSTEVTPGFGQVSYQATGSWVMTGINGLINGSETDKAYINFTNQADLIYRQGPAGSPELSLSHYNFNFRFTDGNGNPGLGTVGIDKKVGGYIKADHMDFDLNMQFNYAPDPGTPGYVRDYCTSGTSGCRVPGMILGWEGAIKNAYMTIQTGGIGYGTGTPSTLPLGDNGYTYDNATGLVGDRSDGLHTLAQWDYDTNFAWEMGEATGSQIVLRFYDWTHMGTNDLPDFYMPMTIDVVGAGGGAGGICFGGAIPVTGSLSQSSCSTAGGTYTQVTPDGPALAMVIRNAQVHAYNTKMDIAKVGDYGNPLSTLPWALIYTYGKMDGNAYFYPGVPKTTGTSTSKLIPGIRADIDMAIQSPGYWYAAQHGCFLSNPGASCTTYLKNADDRWARNTHFMIADMSANGGDGFGIGIVNADLLFKANDLYLRLLPDNAYGGMVPAGALPGGLYMEAFNGQKYHYRGLLGGGNLSDLTVPYKVALIDMNLNTSYFMFGLYSAPVGKSYLGFHGQLDLISPDSGAKGPNNSYFSMAEFSSPKTDFHLGHMTGRIVWKNGKLDLRSASENTGLTGSMRELTIDDQPSLVISNELLMGESAKGFNFTGTPKVRSWGAGKPLEAAVGFGNENFGHIAFNGGHWHSTIVLQEPPTP